MKDLEERWVKMEDGEEGVEVGGRLPRTGERGY